MWWIWVLAALVLIFIIMTVGIYIFTFYSPKGKRTDDRDFPEGQGYDEYKEEALSLIDELRARPCEEVHITSFDGLKLRARYYHTSDGAPLAICCHGYRSTGPRDFCAGSKMFIEHGMNVLLIDERAHAQSEGTVITFGINERQDVLYWTRYAGERFGDIPIFLVGISMGAATVLLSSGLDLPENVRGIMADCPYASPREIISSVSQGMHFPKFCMIFAIVGAKVLGHFDLIKISAVDEVKKTKVPILIVHGLADDFVPEYMSKKVAEANPSMITRVTFPGAVHAMSYFTDKEKYRNTVLSFIDEHRDGSF